MALKLQRQNEAEKQKKNQSKLALALMGQDPPGADSATLAAKLKSLSKASSESASGVDESSDSDDGKYVF